MFRSALPAAANPLITLLGFPMGTLLSSSLLVEAVVGWPGPQLLLQSILQRDIDIVGTGLGAEHNCELLFSNRFDEQGSAGSR